jgi:hypothetical protein
MHVLLQFQLSHFTCFHIYKDANLMEPQKSLTCKFDIQQMSLYLIILIHCQANAMMHKIERK